MMGLKEINRKFAIRGVCPYCNSSHLEYSNRTNCGITIKWNVHCIKCGGNFINVDKTIFSHLILNEPVKLFSKETSPVVNETLEKFILWLSKNYYLEEIPSDAYPVGHFEVSGTKTTILKGSQKVEEWIKRWRKYLPECLY